MLSLKNIFSDVMHLFYPHNCIGCGSDLLSKQELLCLKCLTILPHTDFEKFADNPVEKIFSARIDLAAASSAFYFSKSQLIQHLIHQLKYKGNKEIGVYLGKMMAKSLVSCNRFSNIDYLIPLPLFADKEFKRGYNQAEVICNGMSLVMQVPILTKNVIRIRHTETQTRKHRTERWENVEGSFAVKNPHALMNKNVLLVDDVLTTGATMETCALTMATIPGIRISLATLAIASK